MKIKSIIKTKIHHKGFLDERFGDHFAQISVDTTLKLKSAIKDVCRVLEGFVLPEVDALSRKMPEPPQGVSDQNFVFGYTDSGNWHPGVIDTDPTLATYIRAYPKHWAVVSKALGLARQKSRHACFPASESFYTKKNGLKPIVECDGEDMYTGQGVYRKGVFSTNGKASLLVQGEREVFEYTLDNGRSIRSTEDHQILTVEGWMEIGKAWVLGVELKRPSTRLRLQKEDAAIYAENRNGKLVSSRSLGNMPVYDLQVDHDHHSFVHESGVVVHNCGFVIANRPIHEFIPTTIISDTICTAYTPASVEAVGGVKMDFLVINSLNDISAAIAMAQQRSGLLIPKDGVVLRGKWVPSVRLVPNKDAAVRWQEASDATQSIVMTADEMFSDIWDLPSDQRVFRDISLGQTETVFQFSTSSAIQWLRNFGQKKADGNYGIDSIEAMAAFTALDRPGPLDMMVAAPGFGPAQNKPRTVDMEDKGIENGGAAPVAGPRNSKPDPTIRALEGKGSQHNLLVEYARRARGEEGSAEIFPFFDDLFPETYGVMVYQEQLQFAYKYLTDCSGAEAEEFRRNIAKKKMEKVLSAYPSFIERATAKLGSKDDAEKAWEFFKTWGQYGFNKSHAICYSIIGYACAFMKNQYPLEWWTAVLRNATKEDINEKFWKHCGKLIDLPDVTNSAATFEIVNGRIQAPLSLLHGVGEKAHNQLVAGAPYKDIADFVSRIQAFKESGATFKMVEVERSKTNRKTGEVTKTKAMVEKKKLGSSALNRGIIYSLIISGAMDSLFSEGQTTLEMLGNFEEEMRATGSNPDTERLAKFVDLDQVTRFQMRKSILPAYSTELLLLAHRRSPDIINDNGRYSFRWKSLIPFASAEEIDRLGMIHPFPNDPISFAVMGYVEGQRVFTYKKDKEKEAVEFILDISGIRKKFVKWPGRNSDKLKPVFKQNMLGGIVVVVLTKYEEGRDPSVEDVIVIQPPLEKMPEVSP